MDERVFYSVEDLREYLLSTPEDQPIKITVEIRSEEAADGKEESING